MAELRDGMIRYHGSYCEVKTPDLAKCAAFKDFGKGFYLTSSKEQAKGVINISVKKAKAQGTVFVEQEYGVISTFRYHHNANVAAYIFHDADADWLHCVVGHRKITILTYLVGAYGTIGSEEADSLCISRLIPKRLKDQFCFIKNQGPSV